MKKLLLMVFLLVIAMNNFARGASPTDKPEVIEGFESLIKIDRQACPPVSCFRKEYPQNSDMDAPFAVDRIFKTSSGRSVRLIVGERHCKPNECKKVDAGMWGMDGGIPRFITTVFKVSIDHTDFPIPEKLYKDLTNIMRVSVSEEGDRIVLSLTGGDAAGFFRARYLLGGGCGFEREICDEVCEDIWERTVWHNSFIYDKQPHCVPTVN